MYLNVVCGRFCFILRKKFEFSIQSNFRFFFRWESSNPVHGRSRNPYDTNRIVGGSSGGEGCLLVNNYIFQFEKFDNFQIRKYKSY